VAANKKTSRSLEAPSGFYGDAGEIDLGHSGLDPKGRSTSFRVQKYHPDIFVELPHLRWVFLSMLIQSPQIFKAHHFRSEL
jgi:hypothetical protein